jgi:hypothetical protein
MSNLRDFVPNVEEKALRPGCIGIIGSPASGKTVALIDKAAKHLRGAVNNLVIWVDFENTLGTVVDVLKARCDLDVCREYPESLLTISPASMGMSLDEALHVASSLVNKPGVNPLVLIDGFSSIFCSAGDKAHGLDTQLQYIEKWAGENAAKVALSIQTNRAPQQEDDEFVEDDLDDDDYDDEEDEVWWEEDEDEEDEDWGEDVDDYDDDD